MMRAVPQSLILAQQLSGAFITFGAAARIASVLGYAPCGLWLTPEFERPPSLGAGKARFDAYRSEHAAAGSPARKLCLAARVLR